jgi:methyl-accepting chemotaxis protein
VTAAALPSGAAFRRWVVGLTFGLGLPALAIVASCLVVLFDLTRQQWLWLFAMAGVGGVAVGATWIALQARMLAPICAYLDGPGVGAAWQPEASRDPGAEGADRRAAFAAVMDLPRASAQLAMAGWIAPTVLISLAMWMRFASWSVFDAAITALSGGTVGFVVGSFLHFAVRAVATPVRHALAAAIPEADERRALIRPFPLGRRLLFCAVGVAVVPVVFAVLLSQANARRSAEAVAIRWQHAVLDVVADRFEDGGREPPAGVVAGEVAPLAMPVEVAILELDASVPGPGFGARDADWIDDLRGQVARGALRGDSSLPASPFVVAWRRLREDRVLVARTPARAVRSEASPPWVVFAALLLVSASIAGGLACLLSSDVGRATGFLRAEAERLASGDLRPGRVFESEDELGEVARSFEGMTASLRDTVGRVAEAADRVEATAADMASVTDRVADVTADQVQGLGQATQSMEAINRQVQGIAESSQALNLSVEESSSSALELGATGEELNETASVLSTQVDEVSSSIEQMVRSIRQVSENAGALTEASVETSASMEEMANSLREVDASAEETAELFRQVVGSAESGQDKVRRTIAGMEAIREATETAERVIRGLGARTKEIGAIVDVIDDVADETNLLALNAAIIAAQAGEHGRAFSVVADQIKDLADRVLLSTKEIGALIRALQSESSNAIGAVERGTESVASGVDLSAEAGLSLEEITRASRGSGERIVGIVSAVREQAKAANHVVELMERVRGGVERIRGAAEEQARGNEVVYRGSVAMREVAQLVRGTTEEQARGSGRIRESVEAVRETVDRINAAIQEQSAACASAVAFLETVGTRTSSNEDSTRRMGEATRALLRQAESLRRDVGRFRI